MSKKSRYRQLEAERAEEGAHMVSEEAPEIEMLEESAQDELIDFESWFASRESKIPGHHRREIILADFKARKVPMMAKEADFDEALRKYGVVL